MLAGGRLVRGVAAVLFLLAAFAWVPPHIDRSGLVALGFAFAVLAIPAGPRRTFQIGERARAPAILDGLPLDDVDPDEFMRLISGGRGENDDMSTADDRHPA